MRFSVVALALGLAAAATQGIVQTPEGGLLEPRTFGYLDRIIGEIPRCGLKKLKGKKIAFLCKKANKVGDIGKFCDGLKLNHHWRKKLKIFLEKKCNVLGLPVDVPRTEQPFTNITDYNADKDHSSGSNIYLFRTHSAPSGLLCASARISSFIGHFSASRDFDFTPRDPDLNSRDFDYIPRNPHHNSSDGRPRNQLRPGDHSGDNSGDNSSKDLFSKH
ncbi:hypothetical protein VFPPC_15934 [Pochonia chlamydosporia 170]|uniref:Uncharacterized protein n=1 Tax=Pochonia chlamydosporia 170 TaxID=1380566 RepID=A0A179FVJ8_METCM|nr:hypothetical protein VFPPC_15934 [Pochonia chlamydosporia 170]OAQ69220.1 hypothetical protein VFPPC_15934 [Pochonia chlamydosporia 170]